MDGVVFQRQKPQPGGSWVPSGPNVVILVSSPLHVLLHPLHTRGWASGLVNTQHALCFLRRKSPEFLTVQ